MWSERPMRVRPRLAVAMIPAVAVLAGVLPGPSQPDPLAIALPPAPGVVEQFPPQIAPPAGVASGPVAQGAVTAALPAGAVDVRRIVFPVLGATAYSDTWHACRGGTGCPRLHKGTDLMGVNLQPLLAATDGTVTRVLVNRGISGHGIEITDEDGWTYAYYHLNEEPPNPGNSSEWAVPLGLVPGSRVRAGQVIGFMGDSGNAQGSPHLHFEIRTPQRVTVNPYPSLVIAETASRCIGPLPAPPLEPPVEPAGRANRQVQVSTMTGRGSWLIDANGRVIPSGDGSFIGRPRRASEPCPASRN
jgi:hypothetical protein